jgi:hypothetical protein
MYSPSFWLFLVICDKPSRRLASRFSYHRRYANVSVIHEVAETDAAMDANFAMRNGLGFKEFH